MVKRGPKGGMLQFIPKEKVRDIHIATLEVLETVGMHSPSEKILKVFSDAGAEIDHSKNIVKIPQYLCEEALKKAPRKIVLCGRKSENDILLEGSRVYFGLGGTPTPFILDINTGEFRRPTKKDMEEATRVGDALENMSFIMTVAGVFDVPPKVEYIHEWETLFNNTAKPIVYSAPSGKEATTVLEMAKEIAGGPDELRKRPIMCLYSETVSPLSFSWENENMIEFSKAGIPITLGPMPLAGATAPITSSGAAVISNSENLAAITLIQLVNPGAPVVFAAWGGLMDPKTGRCAYGSPEFALGTNIINSHLARFYDLPTFGFGGAADSKLLDAQAGHEVTMNSLTGALSGINMVHDFGYLAGGSVGSMEMAVVGNEIAGMVSHVIKGVTIDDESLAVEVIKEVGPGGHFLSHEHTLKLFEREVQPTDIFDRGSEVGWVKAGRKDIRQIANVRVKKILKEHVPEPLPIHIKEKLTNIVKQAEKELI
jgi:trimethylamine--corrinoid protein Co-methyltransferase